MKLSDSFNLMTVILSSKIFDSSSEAKILSEQSEIAINLPEIDAHALTMNNFCNFLDKAAPRQCRKAASVKQTNYWS